MKRYICIGGFVESKTDGDWHYISPHKLSELYKVNPELCYFAKDNDDPLLFGLDIDNLIELRPRDYGDYNLKHSA